MNMDKLKTGWKHGWPWGLFMFLWMEILPMVKERKFDPFLFVAGLALWTVGGLCIGLWLNRALQKKKARQKGKNPSPKTPGE